MPAWQSAVPLGSPGQTVQAAPQPVASLSAAHVAPQRWKPVRQVKSHFVPSQVAAAAPVGTGQAVHAVPQELALMLSAQIPVQMCIPVGHMFEQGAVDAIQAPLHSI